MDVTTQATIVVLVATILSAAIAWVVKVIPSEEKFLESKVANIKNADLRAAVDHAIYILGDLVVNIVSSLKQSVVDPAKVAGEWTPAKMGQTKAQAVADVLSHLNDAKKALLTAEYGDLNAYIGHLVDSQVNGQHPVPAVDTTPATPPEPAPVTVTAPPAPVLTDEQKAAVQTLQGLLDSTTTAPAPSAQSQAAGAVTSVPVGMPTVPVV